MLILSLRIGEGAIETFTDENLIVLSVNSKLNHKN